MLFSQPDIAQYVNENFEATWQAVRPVPIVHVDFGNGSVITRTLHGNIATYVCSPEGQVLDILPGIYDPLTYLERLDDLRVLAALSSGGKRGTARPPATEFLREYHSTRAQRLAAGQPAPRLIDLTDLSKAVTEGQLKRMVQWNRIKQNVAAAADESSAPEVLRGPEDLSRWQLLREDAQTNEKHRRLQIHRYLAAQGLVKPEQITKWLYREVLHADLEDPYLGLGSTLFANYPFADEDARRK